MFRQNVMLIIFNDLICKCCSLFSTLVRIKTWQLKSHVPPEIVLTTVKKLADNKHVTLGIQDYVSTSQNKQTNFKTRPEISQLF